MNWGSPSIGFAGLAFLMRGSLADVIRPKFELFSRETQLPLKYVF